MMAKKVAAKKAANPEASPMSSVENQPRSPIGTPKRKPAPKALGGRAGFWDRLDIHR